MCPLRRVEDREAGPAALGVLLPPGRQTFLILRPRALPCDLLLLRTPGVPAFCQLEAIAAPGMAQKVYRALEQRTAVEVLTFFLHPPPAGGSETLSHPEDAGVWLQIQIGPHALVVCRRQAGQPYQPQFFADPASAQALGSRLAGILCPPGDFEQEVYFNDRHFTS